MKFLLSNNALKYALFLTFLISLMTNTQPHRREGKRRDYDSRNSQFDQSAPNPDRKVFRKHSKEYELQAREINKAESSGTTRKRHHNKGFMINSYQKEDQFLRNSDKCPEHSILINGDCVALVDVGLINFLAMIIACGLCLFIFISTIICLLYLSRKCKRKFKFIRKLKKIFGRKSKKARNAHNLHQQLNQSNNSEENINNNSVINADNRINSDANMINDNSNINYKNSNKAYMNVPNYSNYGENRFIINSNNDFSMDPNAMILKNESNLNSNNQESSNVYRNNNDNSNDSFGKKLNGILNYFPSLGKKLINKAFIKNNENEARDNLTQLEMNSKSNVNTTDAIKQPNLSYLNIFRKQNNQNLSKQSMNPYDSRETKNVIQENQFVLPTNSKYVTQDNYQQSIIRLMNFYFYL